MKQRGEKRIKTNSNHVNGSIDDQKMLVKNTVNYVNVSTDEINDNEEYRKSYE